MNDGREQAVSQGDAEAAPGERQQQALAQQLADELGAAGPEGRAHRGFLAARRAAGELQIRHVEARDEQHAGDGAEENLEHASDILAVLFREREEACGATLVGVGILHLEPVH